MKKLVLLASFVFSIFTFSLKAQFSIDIFGGALINGNIKSPNKGDIGPLLGLSPTYDINKKWSVKTSIYVLSEKNYVNKSTLFSISPFVQYHFDENISFLTGYFFRNSFRIANQQINGFDYRPKNNDHGISLQFRYKHRDYFGFLVYNYGLDKGNYDHILVDSYYYNQEKSRGLEIGFGYTFSNLSE